MNKYKAYTAQDILTDAQIEINKLQKGQQFKLKYLFKAVDWDVISKSERITAGTIFRSNTKNDPNIDKLHRQKQSIDYILLVNFKKKRAINSLFYNDRNIFTHSFKHSVVNLSTILKLSP